MLLKRLSLAGGVFVLAASTVGAQYAESFESLNLDDLPGQDLWVTWPSAFPPYSEVVDRHSHSGSQSAMIWTPNDTLADFDHPSNPHTFEVGSWNLSSWVLIPSTPKPAGRQYFIVMNEFDLQNNHFEWNVQLQMDLDSMQMYCDCGTNGTVAGPLLVMDRWTELRAEFDLEGDNVDIYWDGSYIASYPPTLGVYGTDNYTAARIDAMDMYPDIGNHPNTTPVYYDDFAVIPPGQAIGTSGCYGDGGGTPCPCGNPGGSREGCANSSGSGAILSAYGSDDADDDLLTLLGSGLLPGQPSLAFDGDNAINGGNGIPFGDGLRCAGQNVVRLGVRVADANGDASWGPTYANDNWSNGDTKHYQLWYRDPVGPCGGGFNLSNRLSLTFAP